MFDWIPLPFYTPIYYHVLLLVNIIVFFYTQSYNIKSEKSIGGIQFIGYFLFAFVLLYIGLRPIETGYFGDTGTYNRWFQMYKEEINIRTGSHDILFNRFIQICALLMNNTGFFFICAAVYVVPAYIISKKWFKKYWVYSFLMLVGSFSFFAYGTNGIRNGMATSLFLLGFSRDKKIWSFFWFFIAYSFHGSLIIPIAGFISTLFYNKTKYYFYFWLLCIPVSLVVGSGLEVLFANFVTDDRSRYLTDGNFNNDDFAYSGFRWDFLLYSAAGVYSGWRYLYKLKIKDKLYKQLFNIYLAANGFWILVIRANFSNRFAYLSWFLLALIIVYPWLKYEINKEQHKKLGYILLSYYGFTYFMINFFYG